jgi:hypothetical protein
LLIEAKGRTKRARALARLKAEHPSNGISIEAPQKLKTNLNEGVGSWKLPEDDMYEISGFDTSGRVLLKRLNFDSALKKARELIDESCWDVQIVDPDGRVYSSLEQQAA